MWQQDFSTVGRNVLTIADINRLEQAARISMGEFLDTEANAETRLQARHGLTIGIVLALAAIVLLAALFQLT
ncbi:hypothetical protein EB815_07905 [Mesorhizobium loti]|uniref:Uncharacterized protein n=1 Tax=Rhizobium loti TaxID=381 RepID=A0A6M7TXP3_RHILI|nr:hypothetical protein A8145_17560 [Mesorhizobium loti]QKC69066.1 hypothetical protein EB815_07905 [Mesorhizobium loti]